MKDRQVHQQIKSRPAQISDLQLSLLLPLLHLLLLVPAQTDPEGGRSAWPLAFPAVVPIASRDCIVESQSLCERQNGQVKIVDYREVSSPTGKSFTCNSTSSVLFLLLRQPAVSLLGVIGSLLGELPLIPFSID